MENNTEQKENNTEQKENNTEQKLDQILTILDEMNIKMSTLSTSTTNDSDIEKKVKEKFHNFMLKHCNIKSMDDKTEAEMYDFIVDSLWKIVFKFLPF